VQVLLESAQVENGIINRLRAVDGELDGLLSSGLLALYGGKRNRNSDHIALRRRLRRWRLSSGHYIQRVIVDKKCTIDNTIERNTANQTKINNRRMHSRGNR
jgi:hypothetical protein